MGFIILLGWGSLRLPGWRSGGERSEPKRRHPGGAAPQAPAPGAERAVRYVAGAGAAVTAAGSITGAATAGPDRSIRFSSRSRSR